MQCTLVGGVSVWVWGINSLLVSLIGEHAVHTGGRGVSLGMGNQQSAS